MAYADIIMNVSKIKLKNSILFYQNYYYKMLLFLNSSFNSNRLNRVNI